MSKFSKLINKQKKVKQIKKSYFNLEANTNANREKVTCPCGSIKSYKHCCKKIHDNILLASLPLDLMKSRYAAYVKGNIDYLMLSHHSSTRPLNEKSEILKWAKNVDWKSLEIIEEEKVTDKEGFVTFKAFFLENGIENTIYEKSRFLKENKHWTYVDGVHL